MPVPAREATVERAYGGAILRVTGVAPTQGFFNAALVAENDGDPDAAGVLDACRFVAVPPETPEVVGPERTRLLMSGGLSLRISNCAASAPSAWSPARRWSRCRRRRARPQPAPPPLDDLSVEAIETGDF